jgi:hypothetical protein
MSKIIQYKQWHLSFFDENDVEYVRDLGCKFEVHDTAKRTEITGKDGRQWYIVDPAVSYGLEFITENDQQESFIQLKYAGEVKLLRMWHTFLTDTL